MRLKDYGRNQKKRKEYIQQNGLLLGGLSGRTLVYKLLLSF